MLILRDVYFPIWKTIVSGCDVVKVTLIRVVAPIHIYGGLESHISPEERERIEKQAMDDAGNYLDQVAAQLKDEGITAQSEVIYGDIVHEIIGYADTNEVDLIIIATHGHSGVSRWVWGSVTDRVLRSACIPVMMVRDPECIPGI